MKKIFAVLVTLLFVASVFGVAQTMAECGCAPGAYSQTSVQVGDTFTVTRQVGCTYNVTATPGTPPETIVQVSSVINNGFETVTIKALRPGKVTFTNSNSGCYTDTATITIIPKSYPMFSFMKMLGFGKKK